MSGTFQACQNADNWHVVYVQDSGTHPARVIAETRFQKIAELLAAVLNQPRVVISLEGGLVQDVITDPVLGDFLDLVIVDCDIEGVAIDELTFAVRQDSHQIGAYVRGEVPLPFARHDAELLAEKAFPHPEFNLPGWVEAIIDNGAKTPDSPVDASQA